MYNLTNPARFWMTWLFAAFISFATGVEGEVWINEILFNPPSTNDAPNEYIELRGTPNLILPAGTCFVAVEGDANGNPGAVQTIFDLSGRAIGGNGFLVLLQNSNSFSPNTNCFALINTNGGGFGNGPFGPRHRGEGGQTELENGSSTFLLIQTTNAPAINDDIDANDDGVPDGAVYAGWTIVDSVAVLDNDGAGDIGYGRINFRRNSGSTAVAGTVVPINFTPAYVGRTANTTNWAAGSWVTGDVEGSAPNWLLEDGDTAPPEFAGRALNHIGGPNFGAPVLPGVVARETGFSTDLIEGVPGTDSYRLGLNTAPAGNVTIRITAPIPAQISIDGGASFGASRTVMLNSTSPTNVLVRILDDNVVDSSPHIIPITHAITATADAVSYPINSLTPVVNVNVTENDSLLLSELKVNPPGPEDAPYEFIELRGAPNSTLTNVYLLAVEGENNLNPGTINAAMNLSGERLGSSGLLLIVADGHPYSVPVGARVFLAPELSTPGGALGNGSMSFLLVSSPVVITPGIDLDAGDNGIPERLPEGVTILDSVAWTDGGQNDRPYSSAVLVQPSGVPDAASRLPGNLNANSAAAWVFGDVEGEGDSLVYEDGTTVPYGTQLTPGSVNISAPAILGPRAFSSVIGDATTPVLTFQISDDDSPISSLTVNVSSTDQAIVPDANLILGGSGSIRTLAINPLGVGYATILLTVSDGTITGFAPIQFAASIDRHGGGRFHTGASDASTALALDGDYMLVGDDENQVLRIYSRNNSGWPLVQFDMNPFLDLNDFYGDGRPREIDTEGSTRVGNRIYWIGSHSHNRDFEIRTNRARIFATDVSGSGTNSMLTFRGHYDFLKLDLMNWDAGNGHGRGADYYGLTASGDPGVDPKAPDGSGFNIEGLAMAPGSTNVAYICFRAPIVPATNRAKALIVPVLNFAALASSRITNAGAAQFGVPIELNLGGRGIRSIEGNSNGYLIVAGTAAGVPSDTPPGDFRLFTWTGFAMNAPQELGTDLNGLLPEAIAELPSAPWTSNSMVQLISDNGITLYYNDNVEAKFLPIREHKKFRSDWLALGAPVASRPVIKSVQRLDGNCTVTWYSVAGIAYRVQSKTALSDPAWTNVAGDVVATDALASKVVSMSGGTQKFFRVVIP